MLCLLNTKKTNKKTHSWACLLYTSDAADDTPCVDLGGRRIIKKNKKYKKPNSDEKKALEALVVMLEKCNDEMGPEEIQTEIYTVGKENGYKENLRDWFKLIYEVAFGDENGPRMGFFISFFGVKETQQLIKDKIN